MLIVSGTLFSSYGSNTSVTNLQQHLTHKHDITVPSTSAVKKQKNVMESFFPAAKKRKTNADSQFIFNRRLTLAICRDLDGFNKVEKAGFRQFWAQYNSSYKLPCRSTVEIGCLDDLYACCKNRMIEILEKSPAHATVTFDCWSDSVKKRSFIGYTYHFMSDDWKIKTAVLKVGYLQRPHSGEKIKNDFQQTMSTFNLEDKRISVVTDGGPDVVKASELLNVRRTGCISHVIHRLIAHDLLGGKDEDWMLTISPVKEINRLFRKLRRIQKALMYKYEELKSLDTEQKKKHLVEALEQFAMLGMFHVHYYIVQNCYRSGSIYCFLNPEDVLDAEENFVVGSEDELNKAMDESNRNYVGLKSFNRTRWGTHLVMAKSYWKNYGMYFDGFQF